MTLTELASSLEKELNLSPSEAHDIAFFRMLCQEREDLLIKMHKEGKYIKVEEFLNKLSQEWEI